MPAKATQYPEDISLLKKYCHTCPHRFLGLHPHPQGGKVIRLWRPKANKIFVEVKGKVEEAKKIEEGGLFELLVPVTTEALDYHIYHASGLKSYDPYSFLPTFGDTDAFLFNKGVHYELYNALGAHVITHHGAKGVKFAVWAPNAISVYLVSDCNHWDGREMPMRMMGSSGVFELFVPGLKCGEKYKYEIRTKEGEVRVKSDPFAFYCEKRPFNASIVFDIDNFPWEDVPRPAHLNRPMNIYEVHLGSWKREGSDFLNYRKLAHDLAAYCQEMHFTHIELMPVMEHPLDESWGYQVTGYFAATSRYGTPEDFQYFVNHMHKNGIGVFLDWVPAHFPCDDYALARFDGTALYEHADPRQGYHPHWYTAIFNFGRAEVSNFLIASALFWIEKMHVDGLRVDAVASMLYLDYGREKGKWVPNKYGGNFNLEAIEFIKHLNSIIHERNSGVVMIAEESTSYKGVSHPLEKEGLGFDLKWNMGWMNDTLRFFTKDPIYRKHHHNDLTFGLIYAFTEKFVLVLSHDEVVHQKQSLLHKMPGDEWQKFANVRLLYSYMICQPGKKLLFMGSEFGQGEEWDAQNSLHWHLLQYSFHKKLQDMVKDLNRFYYEHPQLWEIDFSAEGFEWIDFSDNASSVISYLRKSKTKQLVVVHNFTPIYRKDYFLPLKTVKTIQEVFNSDQEKYGGSHQLNTAPKIIACEGRSSGFSIHLPPLATVIFEVSFA